MIKIKKALTIIELIISVSIMSTLIIILSSVITQLIHINKIMHNKTILFDNVVISMDFFETQVRTHEIINVNSFSLLEVNSYDNKSHSFLYSTRKNGSICFGKSSTYLSENIKKVDVSNENNLLTINIQAGISNESQNLTRQIYLDHTTK